jgi:hypothetical protein
LVWLIFAIFIYVIISPASLLQEFGQKDPDEVQALCKCQQGTVALLNFRRSSVTLPDISCAM